MQHQPENLKCKFCKGVIFVPCSTLAKARVCTSESARRFGIGQSAELKRHKRLEDHDVLVARGEAEPL